MTEFFLSIEQEWKDEEANMAEIERQMKPILEDWIGGNIPLNFSQ